MIVLTEDLRVSLQQSRGKSSGRIPMARSMVLESIRNDKKHVKVINGDVRKTRLLCLSHALFAEA